MSLLKGQRRDEVEWPPLVPKQNVRDQAQMDFDSKHHPPDTQVADEQNMELVIDPGDESRDVAPMDGVYEPVAEENLGMEDVTIQTE